MNDKIIEIWPTNSVLFHIIYIYCYAKLIDHKTKSKYGHASGPIALSYKAVINDKYHLSINIIQLIYFPYLQNTF